MDKAKSIFLLMLFLLGLICTSQSFHAQAQTGNDLVVRISPPQTLRLEVGDNFTVNVWVDNAASVAAAEVIFTYDPTILNATNVAEGTFLPSAGFTSHAWLTSEVNLETLPPTGKILYSSAIMTGAAASGSGDLLNVTFTVAKSGGTKFHLISYQAGTGGNGTYFTDNVIKQQPNGDYAFSEFIPRLEDGSYGLYVSLSADSTVVNAGQNVTLSGVIAGLGGTSALSASLEYNREGGPWNTLGVVTTNESGFFSYQWTANQTENFGDYEFQILYAAEGSAYQSPIVVVTVEAAFTPLADYLYIALIVLLIIIVALSIFVIIRRRRKVEEAPELIYS